MPTTAERWTRAAGRRQGRWSQMHSVDVERAYERIVCGTSVRRGYVEAVGGFRRRLRVRPADLRQVAMPTLVIWGDRDPLGSTSVAEAATEMIPFGRLEVLPAGHAPWVGHAAAIAEMILVFMQGTR